MKLIIAITGASGVGYAIDLLRTLDPIEDIETHLILSDSAAEVIKAETDHDVEEIKTLASKVYDNSNFGQVVCPGSFRFDGMIIVP